MSRILGSGTPTSENFVRTGGPVSQSHPLRTHRLQQAAVYALATVLTVGTIYFRISIASWVGSDRPILIIFLIPIFLSAALGGLGPGLLSTLVTALGVRYFIMPPTFSLAVERSVDFMQWLVLFMTGLLASVINEALHRSRRQARDNEAWYRLISENTADVLWLFDLQTDRFAYVSPSVLQLRGYTAGEVMEQTMEEVLTPESTAALGNRLPARIAALESGDDTARIQTHEVDQICRDGSVVPTEVVTTLLQDEAGRVTRILGISRNITERRRIQESLRQSEAHYRSLFDNMLNGFAYCRMFFEKGRPLDFVYLNVNTAFETLTGLRDVTGKRVTEVIPGIRETDSELFEIYGRVAITGKPERFETYVEALDMWFSISVYSPRKEHFVAVFDVVTERKQAEQALRESEERLRLALTAANQGLYDLNIQSGEAVVTPEYATLLGYDPKEFHETNALWLERLHPDDRERVGDTYRAYIQGKVPIYSVEFRQRTKSGDWKWLLSQGKIVAWDGAGQPLRMLGTHTDITERKEREEALRMSLEEKVVLLKEVHHRVKNNLQIVASLLNLQANRSKNPQLVETLQNTCNRVRSMALLHEILYSSGNLAHISFPTYVEDLCRQLLRAFDQVSPRVKLVRHIAPVRLPLEQAVPCGLIINELVSNSLKHAFPAGRTGSITVEFRKTDPQLLTLSVRDDGIGYAAEIDPTDSSTLGLQLVSNLAAQLGGQLSITKSDGPGLTFHVAFPAHTDPTFDPDQPRDERRPDAAAGLDTTKHQ